MEPFFSIIIPAHNEEKYISETLRHLIALDYPLNKFEIIVVENGSTDKTEEIVKHIAQEDSKIKLFTSDTGVSRARNTGIEQMSKESDWVVFLDADTIIERPFLQELSAFFKNNSARKFSIGTTEVLPFQDDSLRAGIWFKIYNWGHKYTQTSYSIQICKAEVAHHIRYNEQLRLAEDLRFIMDAKRFGKFFFVPTKNVYTSTRRFKQTGYWRLFFFWIFFGIMPHRVRKKIDYKVLR